ncbi:protein S100-A3 [Choloepus didactylus]|uniref:protein S100-A3 n=1 Tax=Choloepus didactylus TaxID=27675 RepID=UPI00189FB73D|nr:protein S100-A3 [Choloepus didactylus]XP_037670103.1 protein S100-A3 [Choloepus didactylus]
MASAMEQAVVTIVNAYERHAGIRGDRYTLSQGELKELLQKELPTWCPTELREEDYNKFMSLLDTNKDCQVDFVEYMRAIACLCLYCHEYFKNCPPDPPCSQ